MNNLETRAMEICGEEDRLFGCPSERAELRITKEKSDLEGIQLSGRGHSCTDIARFYDPKKTIDQIDPEQLFEVVKYHVQSSRFRGTSHAAKEKFLRRYGNLAVIAGKPGSGKSTLAKRLLREMWESSLYNPDIVFFIQFQHVRYDAETDLLLFLDPTADVVFSTQTERMEILKKLESCDNVYIIMDALDQARIDFKIQQHLSTYSISKAEYFVQNLVAGNILPRSKKLITSRPYTVVQLPYDFQPKLLFTLQGLDEVGLRQICKNICHEDTAVCNTILEFLKAHPDLKSYCHTPLACVTAMEMLYQVYESSEKSKNLSVPFRMTAFFVSLLELLTEKIKGKFHLKSISSLAFDKLGIGQFWLEPHEVYEAGIDFNAISTFLNTLKGTKQMYFVHITWQEFLIAVKLRLYTTRKELTAKEDLEKDILPYKLGSTQFQTAAKFLFGLCNDQVLGNLLSCVDVEGCNSVIERKDCKNVLKNFVIQKLQNVDTMVNLQDPSDDLYFFDVLPRMKWLFEMQDDQFTEQAANCFRDKLKIIRAPIDPSDIASVNYVLRKRKAKLTLIIQTPLFQGNWLECFVKELHATLTQNTSIQVSTVENF